MILQQNRTCTLYSPHNKRISRLRARNYKIETSRWRSVNKDERIILCNDEIENEVIRCCKLEHIPRLYNDIQ